MHSRFAAVLERQFLPQLESLLTVCNNRVLASICLFNDQSLSVRSRDQECGPAERCNINHKNAKLQRDISAGSIVSSYIVTVSSSSFQKEAPQTNTVHTNDSGNTCS